MICLIFPSIFQLALIGKLKENAKLSAFESENKEEKVITTLKIELVILTDASCVPL